jgi:hypothetical protein
LDESRREPWDRGASGAEEPIIPHVPGLSHHRPRRGRATDERGEADGAEHISITGQRAATGKPIIDLYRAAPDYWL